MHINSCKIGKYSTNKSGMKLPLVIPKELKMKVQKHIYNFLDKPIQLTLVSLADEKTKLECEIDNTRKLKNSFKITFALEDQQAKEFLPELYKYDDMTLEAQIEVDSDEQKERLKQISHEQRKKIYAIFNDISDMTGEETSVLKKRHKFQAAKSDKYENINDMFSLSDCSKEIATDFIEYLVNFCLKHGIALSENPKSAFDDIEKYIYICLKNKTCAICGKPAEIHHVDSIGMGNDRNKLDDSKHKKIALCRKHHTEAHKSGWDTFSDKYKIKGIKYTGGDQ